MSDQQSRRRNDHDPTEPSVIRALIIDDDENDREFMAGVARRFDCRVTTAADAVEAMMRVRTMPRFDLLIVDGEMHGMDGLELINTVRAEDRYSDVYALMLTTREDAESRVTALRLGYDEVLNRSASELEISTKLSAARRLIVRQHRLDAAVRELYGLATRDDLTGVYNRRFFFGEAERLLGEGTAVNLLLFDLDDFKRINDTFGHLAGDRVLRDVGGLLTNRTRHEDLIARYGGDQFAMTVVDLPPPQVEAMALRLTADLAALQWTFASEPTSLTVTTGFACSGLLSAPTLAQLLSAADRDLYKNKWMRKHSDLDPALYEYDSVRGTHVLEFVTEVSKAARRKR